MTTISKKKFNVKKYIKEKNKQFNALPPEEKRVLLAREALLHYQEERLLPSVGAYAVPGGIDKDSLDEEESAQKTLSGEGIVCYACALGGLLYTHTLINNKVSNKILFGIDASAFRDRKNIGSILGEYFPLEQIAIIEAAFEVSSAYASDYFSEHADKTAELSTDMHTAIRNAIDFGSECTDENFLRSSVLRFKAIMHNIILNNGTFVPTDEPVFELPEEAKPKRVTKPRKVTSKTTAKPKKAVKKPKK